MDSSKFQHLSPILWTKDLQATISFYTHVLGFTARSNFPNFVSLTRENVELMFVVPIEEPEDCKDPNDTGPFFSKPMLTGSVYITVKEVDSLWHAVKDQSKIKSPIADRDYRMRDFSIEDNNGYEIVFGEAI